VLLTAADQPKLQFMFACAAASMQMPFVVVRSLQLCREQRNNRMQ
jgi:hypothetical protein